MGTISNRTAKRAAIVVGRVDIHEYARLSHLHVDDARPIGADDGSSAEIGIGVTKFVEDLAREQDRMPVPAARRGAKDGGITGSRARAQRANAGRRDQRHINGQREDCLGAIGVVRHIQSRNERRQLAAIRVRIAHELSLQLDHRLAERGIIVAPDNQDHRQSGGAACPNRMGDKRCLSVGVRQKRFRSTHPG